MMRLGVALAAASLAATACAPASSGQAGETARAELPAPILPSLPRQRIVLMSSLPLVYGAGVDMAGVIAGKADPHPLHRALAEAHDLVVPDILDAAAFEGARLAILVQPRGLSPQELVALDGYVRQGGRLLLFADPMLEWPRGAGLADPAGPVRTSLLSPLLSHWGLELLDPGIESVRLGKSGAILVDPGQFGVLHGRIGDAACTLESSAHLARCRVGRGHAVLVADADMLDPAILEKPGQTARANRMLVRDLITGLVAEDTS